MPYDDRNLRKCPFCGSRDVEPRNIAGFHSPIVWAVACSQCGASGPAFSAELYSQHTRTKAIDGWNDRARRQETHHAPPQL